MALTRTKSAFILLFLAPKQGTLMIHMRQLAVKKVTKTKIRIETIRSSKMQNLEKAVLRILKITLRIHSRICIKMILRIRLLTMMLCMMDVVAKTKVTDDMKIVALTSGLGIGSLLWGDLQRKRVDTLVEFLTRAQEFINLEEVYARAYKILSAPSIDVTNAQPSQMTTPSIYPPPTAFTTPMVYGPSTSVQLGAQALELHKQDTVPHPNK
uniref:Uncharacterized protein n=1 Tax=Cannabis sativa TaxID=3483 RepID=A0A803Q5P8_CANSA